jgi:hypothetical protein
MCRNRRTPAARAAATAFAGPPAFELCVAAVQDRDQVGDRVGALRRALDRRGIGDVAAASAREPHDVVAVGLEPLDDPLADEAARACHEHPHGVDPCSKFR